MRDPRRPVAIGRETAAILAANRLARLLEQAGLTQTDVARRLGVTQSRISKLERAEDLKCSTLDRYIAAFGGKLQAGATIGEEVIPLTPTSEAARAQR